MRWGWNNRVLTFLIFTRHTTLKETVSYTISMEEPWYIIFGIDLGGICMKYNVRKKRTVTFFLFFFLMWTPYVSVNAAAPKLSAKQLEIAVGTNAKLTVSRAGKEKIEWKSSNSKVVSVRKLSGNSVRLMAGKKKGSAVVTAKIAKKTLKCRVKVVDWHFGATNGTTIGVGGKTRFKFYGVTAKNFSSSNPRIAKVTKKGRISGLKKGSCYISFDVGRFRYRTKITVVKKLLPDMMIGTHIFADGGSRTSVSSTAKAGKSANLNIVDSATGCYHVFYFRVSGRWVTSGLTFSSSNPSVLTYVTMLGDCVGFYSCQDGRTELKVNYGGNTYKFIVSISDRNSAQFQQYRETVYRSLGLNSGMPRQYVCYLLAAWICDHTVIDHTGTTPVCGVNASYKDCFRHGAVVCSGYADLFMYLCAGLNIPCRQVRNADMHHRWNQVQIDGSWYNIDSCWMDYETDGSYNFQYFLMSDAAMRTLSRGNHLTDPVFPCTDTRFDGCIQEQIALQTQENTPATDRPYAKYSGLNPWVTGNWVNY